MTFLPAELCLALKLDSLVQGKVKCVEKRSAKGRNVVASKQASDTLIIENFGDWSDVMAVFTEDPLHDKLKRK